MNYKLEEIEDQVLATLFEQDGLTGGVKICTHAGDINARLFTDPMYLEGVMLQLPFVFVQYQGKDLVERDGTGMVNIHRLRFRLYIGAQSLRAQKEGQRSAYAMLRSTYDAMHGAWPLMSTPLYATGLKTMKGEPINTVGFLACGPLLEPTGRDEILIVNLPSVVVYQQDWTLDVQAS